MAPSVLRRNDLQVEAEVEESTKAEVRHLKARLVDADQEVCKFQDRMQEVLSKAESTSSDLALAKVTIKLYDDGLPVSGPIMTCLIFNRHYAQPWRYLSEKHHR